MNTAWTSNSDLSAEDLSKQLKAHRSTLSILEKIVRKKLNLVPSPKDYSNPSWPYLRADLDGYNRALTEVLELIKEN